MIFIKTYPFRNNVKDQDKLHRLNESLILKSNDKNTKTHTKQVYDNKIERNIIDN